MTKLGIIVNPNARKNRNTVGRVEWLSAIAYEIGTVEGTRSLEDVVPALRRMLDAGVEYFVADGGDGALHVLVNALRALRPAADLPPVTPTSSGTIDFVARKIGIRAAVEDSVKALAGQLARGEPPKIVSLDSLLVEGVRVRDDGSTEPFVRVGFALAAGGIGQRFFDQYYDERVLGAPAIVRIVARSVAGYFASRLPFGRLGNFGEHASRIFRPARARVTIDGETLRETTHGAIHAGAFDLQLGGVFRVFPLAKADGVLHFQAGSLSPLEMMKNLPNVAIGRLLAARDFRERAGREMIVEALGDELIDPVIDGERYFGLRSMKVTVGPRIRVAVPENAAS